MGLDMYLEKRTYVKNWDHMKPEEKHKIRVSGPAASYINPEKVSLIVEEAAYWRKANAIHKWFVDNVQDGEDNCGQYYVSRGDLGELLKLVDQVLADPSLAPELLPAQDGFFFGSTEYDEWYIEDLKLTKDQLTEILADDNDYSDYYYHSSW